MYVGHKQRACKEVGIASELIRLPEDVSNHTVEHCLEGTVSILRIPFFSSYFRFTSGLWDFQLIPWRVC